MLLLLMLVSVSASEIKSTCVARSNGVFGFARTSLSRSHLNATLITYTIAPAVDGVMCQARGILCKEADKGAQCVLGWHDVSATRITLAWRSDILDAPSIRCKSNTKFDSKVVWSVVFGSLAKKLSLPNGFLATTADDTGGNCAGAYAGGRCMACDVGCGPPTLPGCSPVFYCGQGSICCPVGQTANCWCEFIAKPNAVKCSCT